NVDCVGYDSTQQIHFLQHTLAFLIRPQDIGVSTYSRPTTLAPSSAGARAVIVSLQSTMGDVPAHRPVGLSQRWMCGR
ncbi:MAG: hypothetical protein P8186_03440, partial [Anaerolineae bacterium]